MPRVPAAAGGRPGAPPAAAGRAHPAGHPRGCGLHPGRRRHGRSPRAGSHGPSTAAAAAAPPARQRPRLRQRQLPSEIRTETHRRIFCLIFLGGGYQSSVGSSRRAAATQRDGHQRGNSSVPFQNTQRGGIRLPTPCTHLPVPVLMARRRGRARRRSRRPSPHPRGRHHPRPPPRSPQRGSRAPPPRQVPRTHSRGAERRGSAGTLGSVGSSAPADYMPLCALLRQGGGGRLPPRRSCGQGGCSPPPPPAQTSPPARQDPQPALTCLPASSPSSPAMLCGGALPLHFPALLVLGLYDARAKQIGAQVL